MKRWRSFNFTNTVYNRAQERDIPALATTLDPVSPREHLFPLALIHILYPKPHPFYPLRTAFCKPLFDWECKTSRFLYSRKIYFPDYEDFNKPPKSLHTPSTLKQRTSLPFFGTAKMQAFNHSIQIFFKNLSQKFCEKKPPANHPMPAVQKTHAKIKRRVTSKPINSKIGLQNNLRPNLAFNH